jgi:hypothetical protein
MRREREERRHGLRLTAAPLGVVAALAVLAAPAAADAHNLIECPWTRAALDRAAEGARRRLARPECQRVLDDFRDETGRTLRERLDGLRESADGYLARRMWFVDGSGTAACQDSRVLAATAPGSAVVFVCAPQLRKKAFHNPAFVEAALIHEELHSLGLGENPPSSEKITSQVRRRCGAR